VVGAVKAIRICGLSKLTLVDYPGKVAATVFAGGCNLRCPFCHNAPLVLGGAEEISEAEVVAFLEKRRGLLDGVCVTGGEPLLQKGLSDFLARVKEMGYPVKLDTNGCYPDRLKGVCARGLVDYVAMDVKSDPAHYAETIGVQGFDLAPVRESIEFLLSGDVDYEFRTTVVQGLHTPQIVQGAAMMIAGAKRYYLQKFVDSGNLIGEGFASISEAGMRALQEAAAPYVGAVYLRGV
jgi:pyruvate formate lyase activating enzyme